MGFLAAFEEVKQFRFVIFKILKLRKINALLLRLHFQIESQLSLYHIAVAQWDCTLTCYKYPGIPKNPIIR